MVLSLPFILAFIGSAVALIVGMVIYGDISEAIECPASGGGGGGGSSTNTPNTGTYGSSANGVYYEDDIPTNFHVVSGIINNGVYQEGLADLESQGEIRFGTPSQWNFLHTPTGSLEMSVNMWLKGDFINTGELNDTGDHTIFSTLTLNNGLGDGSINGVMFEVRNNNTRYSIWEDDFEIEDGRLQNMGGAIEASCGITQQCFLSDGQWHMLTLAIDQSSVDGVNPPAHHACFDANCEFEFRTFPFASSGIADTSLTIGGDAYQSGEQQSEKSWEIDEFTVWHGYNLTQSDITSLYNSGAGISPNTIAPTFQVLHASFDTFSAGGGPAETGSEQCQQAKDISWTVIGIIPVALFFSLFAIFSALGTGRQ